MYEKPGDSIRRYTRNGGTVRGCLFYARYNYDASAALAAYCIPQESGWQIRCRCALEQQDTMNN